MTHEQISPNHEQELLHNARVQIDVHEEVYHPSELGLPVEDEEHQFSIADELTLGGSMDQSVSLALIRTVSKKTGLAELFVAGIAKDQQGNKTIQGAWESLSPDMTYTVGRGSAQEGQAKINGTKLLGSEFPQTVSRNHLTLELTKEGKLSIEDSSTNATESVAARKQSRESGHSDLIDYVPKGKGEATAMLEQSRLEKLQPKIDNIDAQIAQAEERLAHMEEQFSDEDSHNLWQFAFHKHQQGAEQKMGHANTAKAHEQVAGKAYTALPADARAVAEQFRYVFDQKTALLARRANLLGK